MKVHTNISIFKAKLFSLLWSNQNGKVKAEEGKNRSGTLFNKISLNKYFYFVEVEFSDL